ncbi:MAG: cytochrome c oxidase assembly protein [Psychrobium sp.]|nr:cytochrome c oxidase assembly protein [Psychrobium sp.]
MDEQSLKRKNGKLSLKLMLVIPLMFAFGFALVPLYDVFCQVTGLNGRIVVNNAPSSLVIDKSRIVRLQFMTSIAPGMPWTFEPVVKYVDVHPGQNTVVKFKARNLADLPTVGQAIPSVSPGLAAQYLNKTECFCFNSQPLDAGESVEMALVFFISPEIPPEITTLTLSYSLFNVTKLANNNITKI